MKGVPCDGELFQDLPDRRGLVVIQRVHHASGPLPGTHGPRGALHVTEDFVGILNVTVQAAPIRIMQMVLP